MTDDVPPTPLPPSSEMLDRYLSGESTQEEHSFVDAWARTTAQPDAVLVRLGHALRARLDVAPPTDSATPDTDARVRAVVAHAYATTIDAENAPATYPRAGSSAPPNDTDTTRTPALAAGYARSPRRQRSNGLTARVTAWRLTAAGAILAGTAMVWTGAHRLWRRDTTEPVLRSYSTGSGERLDISLGDGSRVTLAPRSRLDVLDGFAEATRRVALVGEAHFDVTHTAGAPFVVQTGNVLTRVLGTSFNVRRYRPADNAQIAVVSGKVAAGWMSTGKTVTLTAGMVGRVTDSTATVLVEQDPSNYVTWTNGRLSFRNAPVSEVLETLGRWYGFEFRLADSSLVQSRVTTTLNNRTPETVLRAVALMLDVTMTFDGTTDGMTIVTLHPHAASSNIQGTPVKRKWSSELTAPSDYGR